MTKTTVQDVEAAIKLAPRPKWRAAPTYERDAISSSGEPYTVFDTANLLDDGVISVGIEWQTVVETDGTFRAPLEAFRLSAGDDVMYVESAAVMPLIQAICEAASKAGVRIL